MELHTNYTEKKGLLGRKHVIEYHVTLTPEEKAILQRNPLGHRILLDLSDYFYGKEELVYFSQVIDNKRKATHADLLLLQRLERDLKDKLREIKSLLNEYAAGAAGPTTTTFD